MDFLFINITNLFIKLKKFMMDNHNIEFLSLNQI